MKSIIGFILLISLIAVVLDSYTDVFNLKEEVHELKAKVEKELPDIKEKISNF